MSTTLLAPPRANALSQDENWLTVVTNIPRPQAGYLLITVSGSPSPGQIIRLIIEGEELEFTFIGTPNNSGLQLRTQPNGTNLEEYRDILIDDFRANERIATEFDILADDSGANPAIRLVYKVIPGNTIQGFEQADNITAAFIPTLFNQNHVNHFCKLHVYREGDTRPMVVLQGAYDNQRRCHFNLAGLFQRQLQLPVGSSMYPFIDGITNYTFQLPEGLTKYYLWHADSYGQPAVTERLQKQGPYYAIPGGSSGRSRLIWGTGRYQLCHSYIIDQSLTEFWKPVTIDQPDWAYFYSISPLEGATMSLTARIYYSNGVIRTLPIPEVQDVTPAPNTLYLFPSGPQQLGLSRDPLYATQTMVRYEFIIDVATVGQAKINYRILDDCQDWEIFYLAYENGAGGIETVAMRGKAAVGYQVNREVFRRAKIPNRQLYRGEFAYYDTEGQDTYELPSGWYPKEYVRHLRQLLVADRVWLLDRETASFIAAIVTTDRADLTTEDDDLHSLTIRVSPANPDINSHVL